MKKQDNSIQLNTTIKFKMIKIKQYSTIEYNSKDKRQHNIKFCSGMMYVYVCISSYSHLHLQAISFSFSPLGSI